VTSPALRPARAIDVPAVVDILVERQQDSRFAGIVDVDVAHARKLLAQAAFRHGGTHDGGTFFMVAESDRSIEAFLLAALSRVLLVGDKLCAQDILLLSRRDLPARDAMRTTNRLIDEYVAWATANPRVADIHLSWSDTLPSGERIGALFARKGFIPCGQNYRRSDTAIAAKEAA
jgi:hypothetical protein